jgi:hypothetical protein
VNARIVGCTRRIGDASICDEARLNDGHLKRGRLNDSARLLNGVWTSPDGNGDADFRKVVMLLSGNSAHVLVPPSLIYQASNVQKQ